MVRVYELDSAFNPASFVCFLTLFSGDFQSRTLIRVK